MSTETLRLTLLSLEGIHLSRRLLDAPNDDYEALCSGSCRDEFVDEIAPTSAPTCYELPTISPTMRITAWVGFRSSFPPDRMTAPSSHYSSLFRKEGNLLAVESEQVRIIGKPQTNNSPDKFVNCPSCKAQCFKNALTPTNQSDSSYRVSYERKCAERKSNLAASDTLEDLADSSFTGVAYWRVNSRNDRRTHWRQDTKSQLTIAQKKNYQNCSDLNCDTTQTAYGEVKLLESSGTGTSMGDDQREEMAIPHLEIKLPISLPSQTPHPSVAEVSLEYEGIQKDSPNSLDFALPDIIELHVCIVCSAVDPQPESPSDHGCDNTCKIEWANGCKRESDGVRRHDTQHDNRQVGDINKWDYNSKEEYCTTGEEVSEHDCEDSLRTAEYECHQEQHICYGVAHLVIHQLSPTGDTENNNLLGEKADTPTISSQIAHGGINTGGEIIQLPITTIMSEEGSGKNLDSWVHLRKNATLTLSMERVVPPVENLSEKNSGIKKICVDKVDNSNCHDNQRHYIECGWTEGVLDIKKPPPPSIILKEEERGKSEGKGMENEEIEENWADIPEIFVSQTNGWFSKNAPGLAFVTELWKKHQLTSQSKVQNQTLSDSQSFIRQEDIRRSQKLSRCAETPTHDLDNEHNRKFSMEKQVSKEESSVISAKTKQNKNSQDFADCGPFSIGDNHVAKTDGLDAMNDYQSHAECCGENSSDIRAQEDALVFPKYLSASSDDNSRMSQNKGEHLMSKKDNKQIGVRKKSFLIQEDDSNQFLSGLRTDSLKNFRETNSLLENVVDSALDGESCVDFHASNVRQEKNEQLQNLGCHQSERRHSTSRFKHKLQPTTTRTKKGISQKVREKLICGTSFTNFGEALQSLAAAAHHCDEDHVDVYVLDSGSLGTSIATDDDAMGS